MNITEELKPEEQKLWRGQYRDIAYKISLHAIGKSYTPNSKGIWCFYIFLHESKMVDFSKLWLPDTIYRWKPDAKGRISHDYYVEPITSLELHGGVTFYEKHGHTDGFRCVELGCDYNHVWDMERSSRRLEEILYDVKKCIDSVYENNLIKVEEVKAE